jgi:hypothetical protein
MRLYGNNEQLSCDNQAHFFGSGARSMAQIVVDYASKRNVMREWDKKSP